MKVRVVLMTENEVPPPKSSKRAELEEKAENVWSLLADLFSAYLPEGEKVSVEKVELLWWEG